MVTVRYTETYDLSTQVDKMGLIGVHTPTLRQLAQFYPGLMMNHRFIRVQTCDIVCACASVLPADPLQVGTEAGEIAPQDMFNPILYKAVSNDSFNTILNRLQNFVITPSSKSIQYDMDAFGDTALGDNNDFDLYYSILGSQDGWKKAMPQQGFEMSGLYPILYHVLQPYGSAPPGTSYSNLLENDSVNAYGGIGAKNDNVVYRGNACRMPRFPLHWGFPASNDSEIRIPVNGADTTQYMDHPDSVASTKNAIPQTYVACIITPPAKQHKLYYRMRVTWTFTFEEVIPITEYLKPKDIASRGPYLYQSDYGEQSKSMDNVESTVDTKDMDLQRIMTAGK